MVIIIPVFEGCVNASVLGMVDMLNLSRSFYDRVPEPKASWFTLQLVSMEATAAVTNHGTTITCHQVFSPDMPRPDVIIIPAVVGDLPALVQAQQPLVDYMRQCHAQGTALHATCTGAFFIAATGVLDGREATTSWFASAQFAQLYPQVRLRDERILIDNGTSVTTGATLSFQNLCIYLIEKHFGAALGNLAAKLFLVEKTRQAQHTYAIFAGQKQHGDDLIAEIQHWIESHAADRYTIADLCDRANLAERTFIRRFKAATGNTPLEYVQRVKVELAKSLLEDARQNIKEVSYQTGYEDLTYFRNVFRKYTGTTPAEYRRVFVG